jgi:hypothetical protein
MHPPSSRSPAANKDVNAQHTSTSRLRRHRPQVWRERNALALSAALRSIQPSSASPPARPRRAATWLRRRKARSSRAAARAWYTSWPAGPPRSSQGHQPVASQAVSRSSGRSSAARAFTSSASRREKSPASASGAAARSSQHRRCASDTRSKCARTGRRRLSDGPRSHIAAGEPAALPAHQQATCARPRGTKAGEHNVGDPRGEMHAPGAPVRESRSHCAEGGYNSTRQPLAPPCAAWHSTTHEPSSCSASAYLSENSSKAASDALGANAGCPRATVTDSFSTAPSAHTDTSSATIAAASTASAHS